MTSFQAALKAKEFGHLMILLLSTGMRPQEFRALEADSINLNERMVSITKAIKESGKEGVTKTRKPRTIPISKSVARILKGKIPIKGYIFGGESFSVKDTLRGSYEAFFNRMNKYRATKGEQPIKMLSPQHCRHTCSTEMQRKGISPQIVAAFLGHSNLQTTEGYTHLGSFDILKRAIDGL